MKKDKINKIQKLNLDLIEKASFNSFDGPNVVKDLLAHKDLWESVVMDRVGFSSKAQECCIDLIKLRDISDGHWNVDTLFILCKKGKEGEVASMGAKWHADSCTIWKSEDTQKVLGHYSQDFKQKIVDFWWD